MAGKRVGVLALQGGFAAHLRMLAELDVQGLEVRTPSELSGLDGLILPGGESTTMSIGVKREELSRPLAEFVASGKPVLGTCAGMIMLDRDHLGLLEISTERNAFGRQINSFETSLDLTAIGIEKLQAVFIRAPWVSEYSKQVQVLASVDNHPVAVIQDNILAVAFHPELSDDLRLHQWIISQ